MFPNDDQINWYRVLTKCAICNQGFTEQEAMQAVIVGHGPTRFAYRNCAETSDDSEPCRASSKP